MSGALTSLALAILTSAFPGTVSTQWTAESVRTECEPDGGECVTWAVGRTGGERYKCAEVNTYIAACFQWDPRARRWERLWD